MKGMTMKTAELTGAALDWAVAKCEGKGDDVEICAGNLLYGRVTSGFVYFRPSTDWSQGGPIIDREKIDLYYQHDLQWIAAPQKGVEYMGTTPLIAAMRCYVASKLGDHIELPNELQP